MQFTQGTKVLAMDGKKVGQVDRVVLNPKTNLVTHIVIHKGLVLPKDKVVPLNMIVDAKPDEVTLKVSSDRIDSLEDFQEIHYILVNEDELQRNRPETLVAPPSLYAYPPYTDIPIVGYVEPPYVAQVEEHIPKGTVALMEGAKVISRDDKHIGNVQEVLTTKDSHRATHFVISKGLLLKEKKVVPVGWIADIMEDKVQLAVGARTIEELPSVEHA